MTRKQYFKIEVYHCTRLGIDPEPVLPRDLMARFERTVSRRHSETECSLSIFFDDLPGRGCCKCVNYSVLMEDRNGKLSNGYYFDELYMGAHIGLSNSYAPSH